MSNYFNILTNMSSRYWWPKLMFICVLCIFVSCGILHENKKKCYSWYFTSTKVFIFCSTFSKFGVVPRSTTRCQTDCIVSTCTVSCYVKNWFPPVAQDRNMSTSVKITVGFRHSPVIVTPKPQRVWRCDAWRTPKTPKPFSICIQKSLRKAKSFLQNRLSNFGFKWTLYLQG